MTATTNFLRSPAPVSVSQLAAGRRNVQVATGAQKARGTITFSTNFTAGDQVTLNGVAFTAMAADAAGAEFDIGGTLSLSLDALVTAANAVATAAVALSTYAKSGTTILTITRDVAGEAGNDVTLGDADNVDEVGVASGLVLEGGGDNDTFDIANGVIEMITLDPTAAFTLPSGAEGQMLTLYFLTRGNSGNAVVTGVFTGGTTLTFDAVKERALLQFLGGEWLPLINTSTLA